MVVIPDQRSATALAARLESQRALICANVSHRLLVTYPELVDCLRMTTPSAEARLSAVAVERFSQLVRAVLLFRQPMLADQEFRWAGGVLPRSGVRQEHPEKMVRWFFEELRHLGLPNGELDLVDRLEPYFLHVVAQSFPKDFSPTTYR